MHDAPARSNWYADMRFFFCNEFKAASCYDEYPYWNFFHLPLCSLLAWKMNVEAQLFKQGDLECFWQLGRLQGNALQQPKASKWIRLIRADTVKYKHLDGFNTDLVDRLVTSLALHRLQKLTVSVFQYHQVEESLNDMDFQLFLDLYFTDGDYT